MRSKLGGMASTMHLSGVWTVSIESTSIERPAAATRDISSNTTLPIIPTNEPLPSATLELASVLNHDQEDIAISPLPHNRPLPLISQGVPPELPSLLAEIVFVLTSTAGQFVFSLLIGHVTVTQSVFGAALGLPPSQLPWLIGSFMLASGLSVIVSGPLADLAPPKLLMVGAFLWELLWNVVAAVTITPQLKILFFVARAMQGLAVGVLVSASMSILGRVYNPGRRKTRVFSLMAAGSPFGYSLGCFQAGALSAQLPWIFGSTAGVLAVCALAAQLTIPPLRPVSDGVGTEAPSLRQFDYAGATLASVGCSLVVFGLTQGASANWNPYTYSSIILGSLMLGAFYFVEQRAARPLIPHQLWKTQGFKPLLVSYFLGLGAYSEFSVIPKQVSKSCWYLTQGQAVHGSSTPSSSGSATKAPPP